MREPKYNLLFVVGLFLTLGISTVFANGGPIPRASKDNGILSVETTPEALTVRVDGKYVGMSGVGKGHGAEFKLAPGIYTVEVLGPGGLYYKKTQVTITRAKKTCICLTILNKPACPYRLGLERTPNVITDGETVTFSVKNLGTGAAPTSYKWVVTPTAAADRMTGQGTPSITISSQGLGGQDIQAELDANDGNYVTDTRCTAVISVPVEKIPSCPYRLTVNTSDRSILEGQTVTFTAVNEENSPTPSQYKWKVTPGVAGIIMGQGTSSITVSSKDIVGQEIRAELDTNDDSHPYDNRCTATNSVSVGPPDPELLAWDLQKAILDNRIIQLLAKPNATLYIRIYPGTDKASLTRFTYDRVQNKINSYLTGPPKFIDASQIRFEKGETRVGRTYVSLQVVPPGASPKNVEPPPPSRRH